MLAIWLFIYLLFFVISFQEFIENEGDGEPPLEGSIPDMTSLTEWVTRFKTKGDNLEK